MPLEIRELVIKATVGDQSSGNESSSGGQSGGHNNTDPQQALVNLCVEKVLSILKEKSER